MYSVSTLEPTFTWAFEVSVMFPPISTFAVVVKPVVAFANWRVFAVVFPTLETAPKSKVGLIVRFEILIPVATTFPVTLTGYEIYHLLKNS